MQQGRRCANGRQQGRVRTRTGGKVFVLSEVAGRERRTERRRMYKDLTADTQEVKPDRCVQ